VHVRQLGDFTKDLADALGAGPAQEKLYDSVDPEGLGMFEVALEAGQTMPPIRIDGPYGAPAEDVFNNEVAVLVGTGIGVTPFASVLKHLWHLRSQPSGVRGHKLKRVEFIWICRDPNNFAWFQALLNSLEAQSLEQSLGDGEDFLRIHTYLTKQMDLDTANNIVLNSIGQERDPLTELRSRTNFGRPNFKRLFGGLRDGIINGTYMPNLDRHTDPSFEIKQNVMTTVGVYFCGPSVAARQIKKAALDSSCKEVKFSFWKEHF
jgi:NADPH oxidase 1